MKPVVIIPARLESSRLPRKLLLDKTGKPLIIHTVEAAKKYFKTYVTTDNQEIYNTVQNNSEAPVIITGDAKSGTDRVRKAIHFLDQIKSFPQYDIIVNWQADEPELDGQHVEDALREFDDGEIDIVTLACPITRADLLSPDVVKVVVDHQGLAMYFSRSPIPYNTTDNALKHLGIYVFRHQILSSLGTLDETRYPSENLEQIQWLESNLIIKVKVIPSSANGINTIEDYEQFTKRNVEIR